VADETIVLFGTHAWDDLARHHWALLTRHNPGLRCVPVAWAGRNLPAEVRTVRHPPFRTREPDWEWASPDKLLVGAVRQLDLRADRYLWLEYDTEVTGDLSVALAAAWHAELGCSRFFTRKDVPVWNHWHRCPSFHRGWTDPASYAVCHPFNGLLFDRRTMERFCHHGDELDYCEARVGTFALRHGIVPVQYDPQMRFNHWMESRLDPKVSCGMRHPTKTIRGETPRAHVHLRLPGC